jgi:hypothetical protein
VLWQAGLLVLIHGMSKNQYKTTFFLLKNQYSSPRKQNAMTQLKEKLHERGNEIIRRESNLNQLVRQSENMLQFVDRKCHTLHQSLQVNKKLLKAEITI